MDYAETPNLVSLGGGVLRLTMAAAVYMITGSTGFLVGFGITEVIALVSAKVIKEGLPMTTKVISLVRAVVARKRHLLLSGVTPLMSP